MSVHLPRTISSSAHSAVSVEGAKSSGWKNIPHINQLHPDGANEGYVDGDLSCGPAVVAMLARAANRALGLSDARLIQELGQDLVSRWDVAQDIVTMLERVNLRPGDSAMGSNYTDAALQQQLHQGNKFIVQVEKVNPKTGESSAHYILVKGMTPEGNYRISDPLAKHPQEISPQRLHGLVSGAPPDGGVLIPVTPPRYISQGSEPDRVKPAFTETRGQERSVNGTMARREERHDFELDIDYLGSEAARNGYTRPVLPERFSAHEFADRLLKLKRSGNPEKALSLLSLLQGSPFPRDQRVFDRVVTAELKQPGIGKKLQGDPCERGNGFLHHPPRGRHPKKG